MGWSNNIVFLKNLQKKSYKFTYTQAMFWINSIQNNYFTGCGICVYQVILNDDIRIYINVRNGVCRYQTNKNMLSSKMAISTPIKLWFRHKYWYIVIINCALNPSRNYKGTWYMVFLLEIIVVVFLFLFFTNDKVYTVIAISSVLVKVLYLRVSFKCRRRATSKN